MSHALKKGGLIYPPVMHWVDESFSHGCVGHGRFGQRRVGHGRFGHGRLGQIKVQSTTFWPDAIFTEKEVL